MSKTRVVAAMSGGVDSAVAAALLAEAGFEVVGVTMKTYAPTRPAYARSCCGLDDFDDARRSAAKIGIPHYVLDFEAAFRREVVDRFVTAYRGGRTPNPCVDCNAFVKLGALRAYADRIGAKFVATGHYARLAHDGPHPRLAMGDLGKDQSYALAALNVEQLRRLLLPLGEMSKAQTRREAERFGLAVHDKAESQEICFVEGGDYRDVLDRIGSASAAGAFVTAGGREIGRHDGIARFTVGQRRGLPAHNENDGPRYVTRIDPATGAVTIGREDELYANALVADGVNVLAPEHFTRGPARVRVMTRYRSPLAWSTAEIDSARSELRLSFDRPERAIAPGQLVVAYDDENRVVASATIRSAA